MKLFDILLNEINKGFHCRRRALCAWINQTPTAFEREARKRDDLLDKTPISFAV